MSQKQITFKAAYTKTVTDRTIPINDRLFNILSEWYVSEGSQSEWVFPSSVKEGHISVIRGAWNKIKKEAKLEDFRLYDLRHNFASQLVMKGIDLYTVGKILGHSNVQMTDIYTHLSPKYLRSAVDAF